MAATRIPVTVITGFLGAGKTTLLNALLTQPHGKKIFVIQNEFGQVGIDNQIVLGVPEHMIETLNGCICCTIRSDLVTALNTLWDRRSGVFARFAKKKVTFDRIVIETTGIADPVPIAQTFFLEDDVAKHYELDSVVAVVDSVHAHQQLDREEAAQHQAAFADLILLSKTDIAPAEQVDSVERRVRAMNPTAQIRRIAHGHIDAKVILDLNGFDASKKMEIHPDFLPKQPAAGPDHHADDHHDHSGCDHAHGHCEHGHGHADDHAKEHDHSHCDHEHGRCVHDHPQQALSAVHDKIRSFVIIEDRPVDMQRLEDWLNSWLPTKSADVLRYKGVLNIAGQDRRAVFQGVHMLFHATLDRPWGANEKRQNQLVFIGRELDETFFRDGFAGCLAGVASDVGAIA